MYNTATNSMQFARHVMIAATSDPINQDPRVLRFIAVVITTAICLLLYFSTATGRKLNRYTAYAKITMLFIVLVAGGVKAKNAPATDLGHMPFAPFVGSGPGGALLQVLFAFQGWENATFVCLYSLLYFARTGI